MNKRKESNLKSNISFNHTLEQYNKKYKNRNFRLLKIAKKDVEDFDKRNECSKEFLLKNRKWWLIKDTYYEIPRPVRFTWFRNLNVGVQIAISLGLVGAVVTPIVVPIVLNNRVSDFTKLKNNYKQYILDNTKLKYFKDKSIDEIMSNISIDEKITNYETYIFKDVNYKDKSPAVWSPSEHFYRCLELCVLGELSKDNTLAKQYKNIALKLLLNWVHSDYKSDNWWQNEINANKYLTDIGLLIYPSLDNDSKIAFDKKVSISNMVERADLVKQTGANKVDFSDITIKQGIIKNEDNTINVGLSGVASVIEGKDSSYQSDGTFFQHGNLNQTYSYGFECTFKIIKILSLINKNNKFKLDAKNYKALSKFITSGLKYLTHKGVANYTSLGRVYVRKDGDGVDATLRDVKGLLKLKEINNFPDIDDIENTINNIMNKNSTFNSLVYLKNSKTICLNSDGVYISYKGADTNSIATECRNQENLLGYNLTYGTNTCVMDTGKEYLNVAPFFDYARMPGTTSRSFGEARTSAQDETIRAYPIDFMSDKLNRKLPAEYVGTDGNTYKSIFNDGELEDVVFVSEKTKHEDTFMTVTAFATNDGIAILGSGLDYKDKDGNHQNLTTTVEQCIPNSTCELDSNSKVFTNGNAVYTSLCNKTFKLEKGEVEGSWKRNMRASSGDIIKSQMATVTFDVDDITNYAYVIQSKTKVNKKFEVINNDENIHAIKLPNGKIAAQFYSKDHLSFGDGDKYSITEAEFIEGKGAFKIFNV